THPDRVAGPYVERAGDRNDAHCVGGGGVRTVDHGRVCFPHLDLGANQANVAFFGHDVLSDLGDKLATELGSRTAEQLACVDPDGDVASADDDSRGEV